MNSVWFLTCDGKPLASFCSQDEAVECQWAMMRSDLDALGNVRHPTRWGLVRCVEKRA